MQLLGKVKIESAKIVARLSATGHGDGLVCELELVGCLPRKRKAQALLAYTYSLWQEVEVKLESDRYEGNAPHEKITKAEFKSFLANVDVELNADGDGGWTERFSELRLTPELIEQIKQAVLDEGSDSPIVKLPTVLGRTAEEIQAELVPGYHVSVSEYDREHLGSVNGIEYFKRVKPTLPHYDGIYTEENKRTKFYCHLAEWETSEAYQVINNIQPAATPSTNTAIIADIPALTQEQQHHILDLLARAKTTGLDRHIDTLTAYIYSLWREWDKQSDRAYDQNAINYQQVSDRAEVLSLFSDRVHAFIDWQQDGYPIDWEALGIDETDYQPTYTPPTQPSVEELKLLILAELAKHTAPVRLDILRQALTPGHGFEYMKTSEHPLAIALVQLRDENKVIAHEYQFIMPSFELNRDNSNKEMLEKLSSIYQGVWNAYIQEAIKSRVHESHLNSYNLQQALEKYRQNQDVIGFNQYLYSSTPDGSNYSQDTQIQLEKITKEFEKFNESFPHVAFMTTEEKKDLLINDEDIKAQIYNFIHELANNEPDREQEQNAETVLEKIQSPWWKRQALYNIGAGFPHPDEKTAEIRIPTQVEIGRAVQWLADNQPDQLETVPTIELERVLGNAARHKDKHDRLVREILATSAGTLATWYKEALELKCTAYYALDSLAQCWIEYVNEKSGSTYEVKESWHNFTRDRAELLKNLADADQSTNEVQIKTTLQHDRECLTVKHPNQGMRCSCPEKLRRAIIRQEVAQIIEQLNAKQDGLNLDKTWHVVIDNVFNPMIKQYQPDQVSAGTYAHCLEHCKFVTMPWGTQAIACSIDNAPTPDETIDFTGEMNCGLGIEESVEDKVMAALELEGHEKPTRENTTNGDKVIDHETGKTYHVQGWVTDIMSRKSLLQVLDGRKSECIEVTDTLTRLPRPKIEQPNWMPVKGDRVVAKSEKRHGVITRCSKYTFGLTTSYSFTVQTDNGAELYSIKLEDLEPETAPPDRVLLDPVVKGRPQQPLTVWNAIVSARKDIVYDYEKAKKVRKAEYKAQWTDSAQKAEKHLQHLLEVFLDWEARLADREAALELTGELELEQQIRHAQTRGQNTAALERELERTRENWQLGDGVSFRKNGQWLTGYRIKSIDRGQDKADLEECDSKVSVNNVRFGNLKRDRAYDAKPEEKKLERITLDNVATAKLIRPELAETFPGIKFSVTCDRQDIDIKWLDGPAVSTVKSILKRYQPSYESYDGDGGCYHSSQEERDGKIVEYWNHGVNTRRSYSKEAVEAAIAHLVGKYASFDKLSIKINQYGDGWSAHAEKGEAPDWDTVNWFHREYHKYLEEWSNYEPPTTKPQQAPTTPQGSGFCAVSRNEEKRGIEVRFRDRVSSETVQPLSDLGFRWAKYKPSYLYAKYTESRWNAAQKLATTLNGTRSDEEVPEKVISTANQVLLTDEQAIAQAKLQGYTHYHNMIALVSLKEFTGESIAPLFAVESGYIKQLAGHYKGTSYKLESQTPNITPDTSEHYSDAPNISEISHEPPDLQRFDYKNGIVIEVWASDRGEWKWVSDRDGRAIAMAEGGNYQEIADIIYRYHYQKPENLPSIINHLIDREVREWQEWEMRSEYWTSQRVAALTVAIVDTIWATNDPRFTEFTEHGMWKVAEFIANLVQKNRDSVTDEILHILLCNHVHAVEPPPALPDDPLEAIAKVLESETASHHAVSKIADILKRPRTPVDTSEPDKLKAEAEELKRELDRVNQENERLKAEIERLTPPPTPPDNKPPKKESSNNVVDFQERREEKAAAIPISQAEQALIEIVQAQSECFGADVQALLEENRALLRDILAEQKPKQARKPKTEKKQAPTSAVSKPRGRRKKDKVVEGQMALFDFSEFTQLNLFAV